MLPLIHLFKAAISVSCIALSIAFAGPRIKPLRTQTTTKPFRVRKANASSQPNTFGFSRRHNGYSSWNLNRFTLAAENEQKDAGASSWKTSLSQDPDPITALKSLLSDIYSSSSNPIVKGVNNVKPAVLLVFVGKYHSNSFPEIVDELSRYLESNDMSDTRTLSMIGGGIVGGGIEVDDAVNRPAISMLAGTVDASSIELFGFNELREPKLPSEDSSVWSELTSTSSSGNRSPSYLLFSDPWGPLTQTVDQLTTDDDRKPVIAGGITCPQYTEPTLALDSTLFPQGSILGLKLSHTLGLQAVVAQGCRAIGPYYTITSCERNALLELDGEPALMQLMKLQQELAEGDGRDKIGTDSVVLVGTSSYPQRTPTPASGKTTRNPPSDFLIRQIMGFQPNKNAILVGDQLTEGDCFRFHLRDAQSAVDDWELMLSRVQQERMFQNTGDSSEETNCGPAGRPVAAIQISCVARGTGLFGTENVDLGYGKQLLGPSDNTSNEAPIAGLFANGGLGPVGIAGLSSSSSSSNSISQNSSTFMHGFTAVMALICDYTKDIKPQLDDDNSITAPFVEDDSAWQ